MEFEWDEVKHRRNLAARGLGFDYASEVLESDRIEWADKRKDYGEIRTCALGQVGPDVLLSYIRCAARRVGSSRPD